MTKTAENRIPGRAGSQFPYRHRRSLSRRRAVALPDLRGRAGRDHLGGSRPRHDPDRELGGRPRRRHPSSVAAIRPVHRRRVFPADPSPADGAARRQARRRQDGGKPRPRARAMPQHHPQAQDQADRVGRYRRKRPHRRRARRQVLRLDRLEARGRHLRPRYPGRGRRGRDPQHHPLRGAGARGDWAEQGSGPLVTTFVFRVRNLPAALYKATGRLCHQRRQHDQAGKLHGRRRISSPRNSMPTSTAIPRTRGWPSRWRS